MAQEVEYKILITEKEYIYLSSVLKSIYKHNDILQINVYYDTSDFSLHNKGETLRIRQIDRQSRIEYKFNKRAFGLVRISDEKSLPIDDIPERLPNQHVRLLSLPREKYCKLGNLITFRTNFYVPHGVLSLDKNQYFDYIDYEMELEVSSVEDDFSLIIPEIESFLKTKTKNELPQGKYSRFISRYKERNI